ncbi:UTP11-like, U3 small nucleolar ribonucleoprotein [Geranomyces michiganensis]|nr:UTP11-like, U3 small nucleolar ribonucleoprotein [Geranomyces michiganensis]
MSSLRNAVQRRNHRERSQLASREHRGLLEKHKDYVLRARDYNRKQKALTTLKQKASFRNPDEFYFGMINAETKKGVHVVKRDEKYDHEFLRLLKTQDAGYVNYQRSLNAKKIEKLKSGLHFLEESEDVGEEREGAEEEEEEEEDKLDRAGEEEDESGDGFMELDEDAPTRPAKSSKSASASAIAKPKPRHTIFVDDEEEAKTFSPSKYFDTPAALLRRKYNRPTNAMLASTDAALAPKPGSHKIVKKREKSYRELAARVQRDEQLQRAAREMDLHKHLMGKGTKKKVGTAADGTPIYKWKAERKR